jgi:hypothetical protein
MWAAARDPGFEDEAPPCEEEERGPRGGAHLPFYSVHMHRLPLNRMHFSAFILLSMDGISALPR